MENKVPNQTWIRPKSTGMEVEDDNDLDSVFREELPLPAPQEAYAEVMKHVESIYPKENKMPEQSNSIVMMTPEEHAKLQGVEQPKVKQTRTRAPKATTGKTATPEEMIANMEGKIELLKIINGHKNIEIPAANTMKLAQRELLIGYQNAMDKLKSDTVQLISQL